MSELTVNPTPSPELLHAAAGRASRPGHRHDDGAGANPFANLLNGVLQGAAPAPDSSADGTAGPAASSVPTDADSDADDTGAPVPQSPPATGLPPASSSPTTGPSGNELPPGGNALPAALAEPSSGPQLQGEPIQGQTTLGQTTQDPASPDPRTLEQLARKSGADRSLASGRRDGDVPGTGAVRNSLADLAASRPVDPSPAGGPAGLPGAATEATDGQRSAANVFFQGRLPGRGLPDPGKGPAILPSRSAAAPGIASVDVLPPGQAPLGSALPGLAPDAAIPALTGGDPAAQAASQGIDLSRLVTGAIGGNPLLAQFATPAGGRPGSLAGPGDAASAGSPIAPAGISLFGQPGATGLPALQPLGDPGAFAGGLSDRLLTLGGPGAHSARLTLHPEHLGALDVDIRLDDGTAQVWFGTSTAEARDAIQATLPRLRELFAQQGIQLTRTQVDSGAPQTSGQGAGQSAGQGAWSPPGQGSDGYRYRPDVPAGPGGWRQAAALSVSPAPMAGGLARRLVDVWA